MTFDLSANLALKEREVQVSEMSLLELGPILFGDIEKLISYMRGKGLLASTLTCSNYTCCVEQSINKQTNK